MAIFRKNNKGYYRKEFLQINNKKEDKIMADIKEQTTELVEVKEEKVSIIKAVKAKIADAAEKHPKAAKGVKRVGKIIIGGALVAGGALLGNAIANSNDDDNDISFETDDDLSELDIVD